jgi:hypothetical protein
MDGVTKKQAEDALRVVEAYGMRYCANNQVRSGPAIGLAIRDLRDPIGAFICVDAAIAALQDANYHIGAAAMRALVYGVGGQDYTQEGRWLRIKLPESFAPSIEGEPADAQH